ncbi:uncharacterized protein LOC141632887 [Silene latifolia]|uniref:uncharacterized protein LOC141632887 n=1 Tax=Silene latifolia TaxID=37657 RepID=UPI003D78806F
MGRDVCVDLTGSSPLTWPGMSDFMPRCVVVNAAERKCAKYRSLCEENLRSPFSCVLLALWLAVRVALLRGDHHWKALRLPILLVPKSWIILLSPRRILKPRVLDPRSPVLLRDYIITAPANSVRKSVPSPSPRAPISVTSCNSVDTAIVEHTVVSSADIGAPVMANVTATVSTIVDPPIVPVISEHPPSTDIPISEHPHTEVPTSEIGDKAVPEKRKWADVVKGNDEVKGGKLGMSLFFDEHSKNSSEIDVDLEDFQGELDFWKFTLMGNFLGSKPNLKQVQDFAQKCWHHIASPMVQYYKKGWFSFRFTCLEDMNAVLREGPWKLNTSSLILKQWYPNFSMEMDRISKLSFARILVEADVSGSLPDNIVINTPYHGQSSQRVIYEWLPFHCSGCGKLGHQIGSCKWHKPKVVEPKKIYKPKQLVPTPPSAPQSAADHGSECPELGGTSAAQGEVVDQTSSEGQINPPTVVAASASPLVVEMHSECLELGQSSPQTAGCARVVSRRSQIAKKRDSIVVKDLSEVAQEFSTSNRFDTIQPVTIPQSDGITNKLDILGVLETRVRENNAGKIIKKHFHSYKFIHCSVVHQATDHKFHMTMVYGSNDSKIRKDLWLALSSLHHTVTNWITLGDFNVVRDVSERLSSTPPDLEDILDFNECILDCQLEDINGSATAAVFLPAGISDHSPVLDIVTKSWHTYVEGTAMFRIFGKLKHVKKGLLQLHKENFSNLSTRVTDARTALLNCQMELQHAPLSRALIETERMLLADYNSLKAAEISMLQQKAKIDNIKHGDCSSKYFFSKLQERQQQHIIGRISDINGHERIGLSDVADGFMDYFKNLLGASSEVCPLDFEFIQQSSCVAEDAYSFLTQPVTVSEIKTALFSIGSDKSPSPDGFSTAFFKDSWDLIETDFCKAVLAFFKTGKMSKLVNSTLITLILKKKISQSVQDFRPMSCCTTIYKTVSKILANRLKPILPSLVGPE